MTYHIIYHESVVKKDIPKLNPPIKTLIKQAIEEKLIVDPVGFGKPLRYSLKGHRRLRVGDYRVIYRIIPANKAVIILAIGHRRDIYEN